MMKKITKFMLIGLAVATVISFCSCSKYKGFKQDDSGFYYQFHGDIHDTAPQPKTGDYVVFLFSLRAGDSLLLPMSPQSIIMDSLYEGDIFAALRSMHVDDSATFILDGPKFFEKMLPGQDYTFGEDPFYVDMKLLGLVDKEEVLRAQAEYAKMVDERKELEPGEIEQYLQDNPGLKMSKSGVYVKNIKQGKGPKVETLQKVKVNYKGSYIDGRVFDSSQDGEPFTFTVGAGQVIPGWDAVVSEMRVGDKVTVLIPSHLAYGEGNQVIPPYTPLVFDIELLEIAE